MQSLRDAEPTFDSEGYPTEETCAYLELAPMSGDWSESADAACDFMARAWHWRDSGCLRRPDGIWVFATGGWSGNEQLISAFQRSILYLGWLAVHVLHLTGGLYVIPVSNEGREIVERVRRVLTDWAWGLVQTRALCALSCHSSD